MNKNKQAITFVEILVTLVILSILGLIGFLGLGSYGVTTRDSTRLVEIENIESSLGAYVLKKGVYPDPTNGENVTYSGSTVWIQGTFGNSVSFEIGYSQDILDPLTKNEYTYSIKNTKKEYSLAGVFEERPGLVFNNNIVTPTVNAQNIGEKKGIALVRGNYNGEIISISSSGITTIIAVPSIISSDLSSLNLLDIINNNKLVYNEYNNLPASYSGTIYNLDSGTDFSANQLEIYNGKISDLDKSYNQITFLQNLYLSYSGSIISKNLLVNQIDKDDLFSLEPSNKIRDAACDVVNFKLKYFVECGGVDFLTFFVINVLHIDVANLPGTKITAVYQDTNGNFVFGTDAGVVFYDGTNWVIYTKQDSSLVHNQITSITQDNNGNYWIGTYNGISKLTIGDITNKSDDIWVTIENQNLVSTHIQYIYTDNDGVIWIGTNKGVSTYNGDIWSSYSKNENGLSHDNITAIYTDSQGHVWFGTNSKGVDKFTLSDPNCQNYWHDNDDDDHDGNDEDHDGNDEDHHCNHTSHDDHDGSDNGDNDDSNDHNGENDIIVNYNSGKLPYHKVTYIFEDSTGKMWVGTQGGIGVSTNYGNTWSSYTTANTSGGLIGDYIEYLFEDNAGNIWVGTSAGLSKFNGTTWTTYSTSNGLLGNSIFLINQDASGNIIIFSNGGLDTIDSAGNIIT